MQTSLVVQCRQVPELKKAALYKRGWGASVLVRRCKHLPFYQQITLYARAIYGVNAQIVGAALVLAFMAPGIALDAGVGCTN